MNARQKAKKYKRELDILKGQVAPYKVTSEDYRIETLRVEQAFDREDLAKMPLGTVQKCLARALCDSEEFQRIIIYETYEVPCFHVPMVKYRADLKVVMPDDNSSDWSGH